MMVALLPAGQGYNSDGSDVMPTLISDVLYSKVQLNSRIDRDRYFYFKNSSFGSDVDHRAEAMVIYERDAKESFPDTEIHYPQAEMAQRPHIIWDY